jgi:hypothetical protein
VLEVHIVGTQDIPVYQDLDHVSFFYGVSQAHRIPKPDRDIFKLDEDPFSQNEPNQSGQLISLAQYF